MKDERSRQCFPQCSFDFPLEVLCRQTQLTLTGRLVSRPRSTPHHGDRVLAEAWALDVLWEAVGPCRMPGRHIQPALAGLRGRGSVSACGLEA